MTEVPYEEFDKSYALQKLEIIKTRRIKYVGYVARIAEIKLTQNFSLGT